MRYGVVSSLLPHLISVFKCFFLYCSLYIGVYLRFLLESVLCLLRLPFRNYLFDVIQEGESLLVSLGAARDSGHLPTLVSFLISLEAQVSRYSVELYNYSRSAGYWVLVMMCLFSHCSGLSVVLSIGLIAPWESTDMWILVYSVVAYLSVVPRLILKFPWRMLSGSSMRQSSMLIFYL